MGGFGRTGLRAEYITQSLIFLLGSRVVAGGVAEGGTALPLRIWPTVDG